MAYTVGNLEVQIASSVTDASANIDTLMNKLSALSGVLRTMQTDGLKPLTSLSGQLKSLVNTLGGVDTKKMATIFDGLTTAITPFINKVKSAEAALVSLNSVVAKFNKTNAQSGAATAKVGKAGEGVLASLEGGNGAAALGGSSMAKFAAALAAALAIAKKLAQVMSKVVQYAIDYNETLNLWQVAMRNSLSQAETFVDKMSKAYGLSRQTLMNYQAIFKNMLSGLGDLSEAASYQLSEVMTGLAIDFASLYNQTIESSMVKFQAILSGQVRPVRSVSGIDITEQTIYEMYRRAGGEKTVRGLSQIEKRLLRIYATFGQMQEAGTIGDYAKTIEQAANQFRIMSEQAKETAVWLGQMVLQFLQPALPYVNAILMTLKELFKTAAFTMGYEDIDFLEGMQTITEGAETAEDAVNKLMGTLSFDRFEALKKADGNIFGLDPVILAMLEKMKFQMGEIKMRATEIMERWMGIFGYVFNTETKLWEIKEIGYNLATTFKAIGIVFSMIADTLERWSKNLKESIQDIKDFFNVFKREKGSASIGTTSPRASGVTKGAGVAGWKSKVVEWITPILFGGVKKHAVGGIIEDGIFTMNKGEIAGRFNDGSSVVANNEQIIQGIQRGVYTAVVAALSQQKPSGGGNVYIDGAKVGKVVERAVFDEGTRVGHFSKV